MRVNYVYAVNKIPWKVNSLTYVKHLHIHSMKIVWNVAVKQLVVLEIISRLMNWELFETQL